MTSYFAPIYVNSCKSLNLCNIIVIFGLCPWAMPHIRCTPCPVIKFKCKTVRTQLIMCSAKLVEFCYSIIPSQVLPCTAIINLLYHFAKVLYSHHLMQYAPTYFYKHYMTMNFKVIRCRLTPCAAAAEVREKQNSIDNCEFHGDPSPVQLVFYWLLSLFASVAN